jgi:hypothetical protein
MIALVDKANRGGSELTELLQRKYDCLSLIDISTAQRA